MKEEDVIRFKEAQGCSDCVGWLKNCNAECCKMISLGIHPDRLDEDNSDFIVIKLGKNLNPSDQYYYSLRGVRYTRGTLKFEKKNIHIFGRKVVYMYPCSALDDDNLCKIHLTSKPSFCKSLTLETSDNKNMNFEVTENCLFKYKVKGGFNNG